MSMVINTNMSAASAAKSLQASQASLDKSLARLSSGSKITSASDDAGGLAVSMKMDSQIERLKAGKANIGNAVSFTQAQDGYLANMGSALDRMGELSLLAKDGTKTDADREMYDLEYQQLAQTVSDITTKTWNGINLFSDNDLSVTTDSEGGTFKMIGIDMADVLEKMGGDISTFDTAGVALDDMKDALSLVASSRAIIGSNQTRLHSISEQIVVASENLFAASSRIQDVDVAEEASEFARFNILVQSGTAMLAQANQIPQNVLRLLQ